MFVAVTRAKQNIYISSYQTNESSDPVLASGIIRDLLATTPIDHQPAESIQILEQNLVWPRLEGSSEKLLLADILEDFRLSATALLNFLDVTKGGPSYFLERHALRLPEASTSQAAFGRAVHSALEQAQIATHDSGQTNLDHVLASYQQALASELLAPAEHQRYLTHGQNVLTHLFQNLNLQLQQSGLPEVKIPDIHLGTARLHGNLDRIDVSDKTLLITDYKTGNPLPSLQTHNKTLQTKAWRHRTQLQFYALLATRSNIWPKASHITAQMTYVEADTPKQLNLTYTPSAEDLARLEKLIHKVWQHITSLNLPDVRHYDETYQGIQKFEEDLLESKV